MNFLKLFSNYNNKIVAAICMIMASTLGVFMISIIKYVQTDLNVYTISFFRFFFGLFIILPYHHKTNYRFLKTKKYIYMYLDHYLMCRQCTLDSLQYI